MDLATLGGIFSGIGLLSGAVLSDVFSFSFMELRSAMFIAAGTMVSLPVSSSPLEIQRAFWSVARTFFSRAATTDEVVAAMVKIAELSRREGIGALVKLNTSNPLLLKAALLIADGADESQISEAELDAIDDLKKRHNSGILVFRRLGYMSAALGIGGAAVCLADTFFYPHTYQPPLGPAITIAAFNAFCGAVFSHAIFAPLAEMLKKRGLKEESSLRVVFAGVRYILENNNPRLVYDKLSSFLPTKRRSADAYGW